MSGRKLGDQLRVDEDEGFVENEHRVGALLHERGERPLDVGALQDLLSLDLQPHSLGHRPGAVGLRRLAHFRRVEQNADAGHFGHGLAQERDPLRAQLRRHTRYAGDVAARPREARDEAGRQRIAREHDDRNRRGGVLRRDDRLVPEGHDDVHLEIDQLAGQRIHDVVPAFAEPILDHHVLFIDVTELAEALHEGFLASRSADGQEADARDLRRRLRLGGERRDEETKSQRGGQRGKVHRRIRDGVGCGCVPPLPRSARESRRR